MAQINAQAIVASLAVPSFLQNFKVDTAFVSGKAFFTNEEKAETNGSEEPIPIGSTTYKLEKKEREGVVAQTNYDFDGDDELEIAVLGDWRPVPNDDGETVDGFVKSPDQLSGELQGIFLSSGSKDPDSDEFSKNQPDFVRLADYAPDLQDQGLLEFISEDDIKDTDVYVFRESNGKIIARKEEQKDSDFKLRRESGFDYDSGEFYYGMMIRGPDSAPFDLVDKYNRSGPDWYSAWQSEAEVDPTLHSRESDKMRPHEKLLVVAINRKTGYIGTMRTEYGKDYRNGIISPIVPKDKRIVLRPPNLKISAERMYKIDKGASADPDEEHKFLIGNEGAALTSDVWVKVTTEWFDHDGTPLPKDLAEEGYTGRLAKISGENVLDGVGSPLSEDGIAHFKIKPGRHTENIQITGEGTLADHFYVQVSGEQKDENPDFSTLGAGEGELQYRPKNYVPFKVAIQDETQTWEQYTAYKKLKREEGNEDLEKPDPIYKWFYRPELQFSLYQLHMQDILRVEKDENDNELSVSVYNDELPVIASSDDLVRILYNLLEKDIAPLEYLGDGHELVFALGEEEVKVEFGEDKQLEFENLEHLSSLDIEDFLSLRLYRNNDPGNVLWEYAFEHLVLDTRYVGYDNIQIDEETGDIEYYVTADEPEFPLISYLVGYAGRDEESKPPFNLEWRVDSGQGAVEDIETNHEAGVSTAMLNMQPTKNFRSKVFVKLPDSETEAEFGEVVVKAGKPSFMQVNLTGEAYILGHDQIEVEIDVFDQHGNRVEDETSVELSISGNAVLNDYEPGTIEGKVTANIRGNNKGRVDNELTVKVGELEESYTFEIKPFDIQFVNTPSSFEVEKAVPISVMVSAGGEAVSGVDVTFFSTMGKLDSNAVVTDGSGMATKLFHTGFNPANGELFARVGLEAVKMPSVDINPPADSKIDAYKALVVGDASSDGSIEYERFDGAVIAMPYKASTEVGLSGNSGEQITLQLGDLTDPNRTPLVAFYMKEILSEDTGVSLAKEETGIHRGVIGGSVQVVKNQDPTGVGKSYLMDAGGHILTDASEVLSQATSIGFRVDIKPDTQEE